MDTCLASDQAVKRRRRERGLPALASDPYVLFEQLDEKDSGQIIDRWWDLRFDLTEISSEP